MVVLVKPAELALLSALVAARLLGANGVAFPSYQDPQTAEPSLPHPKGASAPCAVRPAVLGANLSGYGQVVRSWFEPPDDETACSCSGRGVSESCWSQVVLLFDGHVRGVQFDRFGAVWFRGVELLRTTTPEPSPSGIEWHVERDITDFQSLFRSAGEMTLMIPNVVDPTYTGVLHINVSIAFYQLTASAPDVWTVLPLQDITNASDPLNRLANSGALGQASAVKLDPASDVNQIRLHVFASGHGCEEFWYTNVPGTDVPSGTCGGGAYRELLVYIDGVLADAVLPFPVIYTGGINPLLWRPLTGILSFDIPPYEFDLTPFASWLLDGAAHNVTVQVWGNNPQGTWFLDPVLLLRHAEANQSISGGRIRKLPDSVPNVTEQVHKKSNTSSTQWMRGSHSYEVQSQLHLRSGQEIDCLVSGEIAAESTNVALSATTQVTRGRFTSNRRQTCGSWKSVRLADFRLNVVDVAFEDNKSLFLNASINLSRALTARFEDATGVLGVIELNNSISSAAVYNRSSVNHSQVNLESANSSEHYQISTETGGSDRETGCYEKHLTASRGYISSAFEHNTCEWPFGVYVCGSTFCGHPQASGPFLAPGLPAVPGKPTSKLQSDAWPLLATLRRPSRWSAGESAGVQQPMAWTQSWQPEVLYS